MPDRRHFLAASAALASAGADSGKPVRVAVVGTGGRGCDLVRSLTTIDRAAVAAVCDTYPPHLARGAEFAGSSARPFASFASMLKEIRPEAVVVATPLRTHFDLCMAALDAGAAVFCEKTMCYSVAEARELAAAVEKRGAVFQVGLQRRANAVYRQAAAMVKAGMLGRVTAIECQWHRNGSWRRPVPVPKGHADWARLERQLNWRLYADTSGGLMAELAGHQLDVANWLLGTRPRRVLASGGVDYWRDGREVCDNVFCVYEYDARPPAEKDPGPAGAGPYTARVTYSSIQTNAYEGASELVLGTKGTLYLTSKKGLFYREGWRPPEPPAGGAELAADITAGKTLKLSNDPWAHRGPATEIDADGDDTRDELVEFLRCVRERDPATICDAVAGLENAATVLMANEAVRTGRAAEWPAAAG